jgi:[ribosomal protein S18]-alanine N-acetyltransferase
MEKSFSPREATAEDIPRLVAIEQKIHPAPHAKWTEEHFQAELEKPYSKIWVLTDDETDTEIAAYLAFWMMYDECQILNVGVDLPFRGMGHAQFLIRRAIDQALRTGLKRALLDVRKSNVPAIQLYQKLRFTVQHVRKGFYADGEDAYGMVLSLEGEPAVEF